MKRVSSLLILCCALLGCPGAIDTVSRKELSGGYIYEEIDFPYIYRDTPTRKYIPAIVKSYSYDSNFIVASQLSTKACNERLQSDYTYDDCNRLHLTLRMEPSYWIISHVQDSVYGSLSSREYIVQRDKLHLPNSLMLEE